MSVSSRKSPELVAPAGNPAKLRTALHFGADAVYLGLKKFSLRATAGNFSEDELAWAIDYAHQRGARVYVTVNVQPFDEEFADLEATLLRLGQLRPDALVVADAGVLEVARRITPELRLHLSTQASVTNRPAADHWLRNGIERIVLARELSLAQLEHLAASGVGEFEVFVQGAVCIAMSGRCFMSLYWAGSNRDPRHGSCAQPCRWPYRTVALEEARYPGRVHEVEADDRGTYFFDGRDLCALPVLERLIGTGIHALKIEGRSRSLHYLGTVVDVYRNFLDRFAAGEPPRGAALQALIDELRTSSKRAFSTHFLDGEADLPSTYQPEGGSPGAGEAVLLGIVRARHPDSVDIELENALRPGVTVELRDRGLSAESLKVTEIHTPDGRPLDLGRRGDIVRIPGAFRAGPEALVRVLSGSAGAAEGEG